MMISYRVAPDDVVALNIHATETAPGFRVLMRVVTVAVAAALWWMVTAGTGSLAAGVTTGAVGGAVYLIAAPRLATISVAAVVRRRLRAAGSRLLGDHAMEITPHELVGKTSGAESRTVLAAVRRVVRRGDRAFIYVATDSAYVLPRRGVTDGDYDAFLTSLQRAVAAAKS